MFFSGMKLRAETAESCFPMSAEFIVLVSTALIVPSMHPRKIIELSGAQQLQRIGTLTFLRHFWVNMEPNWACFISYIRRLLSHPTEEK